MFQSLLSIRVARLKPKIIITLERILLQQKVFFDSEKYDSINWHCGEIKICNEMIEKILIIIIPVTHGLSGAALFLKRSPHEWHFRCWTLSDLLFRVHNSNFGSYSQSSYHTWHRNFSNEVNKVINLRWHQFNPTTLLSNCSGEKGPYRRSIFIGLAPALHFLRLGANLDIFGVQ